MEAKFPSLFNEIECINLSWGWVGCLDALEYISRHEEEYRGTQCFREFRAFVREMSNLF
jgi:hypothetical protein